ncbi:MAG TPA: murein transglycosylase [Micromonosporaceae bacterium]
MTVLVLAAIAAFTWETARTSTPPDGPITFPTLSEPVPTAPAIVPSLPATARPTGTSGAVVAPARLLADPAWVASIATRTGIPARALSAYVEAQLTTTLTTPSCHIGWTMLAGIGGIESNHGRFGGASLESDGLTTQPILGPPLNGTHGNKAIRATAAGVRLDGDAQWDHAVGPMQFLPSTWTKWGVSANGGVPNPNNIDDASLTAARYLCAAGGNLSTPTGWRNAIGAYNAPQAYAVRVTDLADQYAQASLS